MSADCGAHEGAAAELRAFALTALDRLDPVLERLRAGEPSPDDAPACTACPVCALLGVLRGERPEMAARLAEHASGLVDVLRAALEESGAPAPGPAPEADEPARPRVQKIAVQKVPVQNVAVQQAAVPKISVVRP